MTHKSSSIGRRLAVGAIALVAAFGLAKCAQETTDGAAVTGRFGSGLTVNVGNRPDKETDRTVGLKAADAEPVTANPKDRWIANGDGLYNRAAIVDKGEKLDAPIRTVPQTHKFLPGGDSITYGDLITGDRIEFGRGASVMIGDQTDAFTIRLSVTHHGLDQNGGFTTVITPIFAKFGEPVDSGLGYNVTAYRLEDKSIVLKFVPRGPEEAKDTATRDETHVAETHNFNPIDKEVTYTRFRSGDRVDFGEGRGFRLFGGAGNSVMLAVTDQKMDTALILQPKVTNVEAVFGKPVDIEMGYTVTVHKTPEGVVTGHGASINFFKDHPTETGFFTVVVSRNGN